MRKEIDQKIELYRSSKLSEREILTLILELEIHNMAQIDDLIAAQAVTAANVAALQTAIAAIPAPVAPVDLTAAIATETATAASINAITASITPAPVAPAATAAS